MPTKEVPGKKRLFVSQRNIPTRKRPVPRDFSRSFRQITRSIRPLFVFSPIKLQTPFTLTRNSKSFGYFYIVPINIGLTSEINELARSKLLTMSDIGFPSAFAIP
jgi:hypothetical protein